MLHRVGTVEQGERVQIRFHVAQIVQIDELLNAGVNDTPLRIQLIEMANPVAAFQRGFSVANGECQQRLELAHTQVGPEGIGVCRHANQQRQRTHIREPGFVQGGEQIGALIIIQIGEIENGLAEVIGDTVVLMLQIVNGINLRHARHQDAATVDAQMREVGDVNVVIVLVNAIHGPGVVFGGGGAEVPVAEFIVRRVAEEVPVNDTARIDEVNFDVHRTRRFVEIKSGRRKARQRVQRTAL